MVDDNKKVVLTDESAPEPEASIEDEKPQGPTETRLDIRFAVTPDGLVDLAFDQKIDRLTIAPEFAVQLSKALFTCAAKAATIRSPLIVPGLVEPGLKIN